MIKLANRLVLLNARPIHSGTTPVLVTCTRRFVCLYVEIIHELSHTDRHPWYNHFISPTLIWPSHIGRYIVLKLLRVAKIMSYIWILVFRVFFSFLFYGVHLLLYKSTSKIENDRKNGRTLNEYIRTAVLKNQEGGVDKGPVSSQGLCCFLAWL